MMKACKNSMCASRMTASKPEATGTTPLGQGVGMAQTVFQGREWKDSFQGRDVHARLCTATEVAILQPPRTAVVGLGEGWRHNCGYAATFSNEWRHRSLW